MTEQALAVADVVADVAAQVGASAAQTAIAWTLRNPAVTAPILGARTVAQLEDNLGALDVRFTAEQQATLDRRPARDREARRDDRAGILSRMTREIAGDVDYETHGAGYSDVRRADERIAGRVVAALGPGRSVVNVGAGAGSYEPVDRHVVAVEPSARMRAQRPPTAAPAIDATAESLPLDDDSVDAAMATVTVHQWRDVDRGLREMRRVSRGPVVVLTFDGDALDRFWLAEYAPELIAAERGRYPAVDRIRRLLGGDAGVQEVPVPADCTDGFTEAFYARPERFLDSAVRRAQSAWGFVDDDVARRAVAALERDLVDGTWDRRFGHLRRQPTFTGALRLVVAHP